MSAEGTEATEYKRSDIDVFPRDPRILARLSPEERAAIYLNSIRKMFLLLIIVIAVGIVAAAVFAIITIHTIDSLQRGVSPF